MGVEIRKRSGSQSLGAIPDLARGHTNHGNSQIRGDSHGKCHQVGPQQKVVPFARPMALGSGKLEALTCFFGLVLMCTKMEKYFYVLA